jgi:hypothetical protein
MNPKPPPREQEQSIRARKQQLFEADEATTTEAEAAAPRKPFSFYLQQTPAAPLSSGTKFVLWGAGALVLVALAITVFLASRPRQTPTRRAEIGRATAIRVGHT